ncbi:TIGR03032 family protein [Litoribrevibacter albus]|uniref:TIGR03032 family protein n=1 Tax=Litoribrevibacter albus TaxID=1473156 RepID=A0AA37S6Z9_9GAMM|nr:TIGR03032 family protein [Litoribrevibacter albus]GLQ30246.1 TIGR03032 family protein [Litoribrevibacter albus]
MTQQTSEDQFDLRSVYSDNLPQILKVLNISLVITSYQAGQLILIRSDGDTVTTCSKEFPRPMGVYADQHHLTLGTATQVIDFQRCDGLLDQVRSGYLDNEQELTKKILEKDEKAMEAFLNERRKTINQVKKANALYLHRAAITTGMINIHDIAWGDEGLWVVNSTFSCLATLAPDSSFIARWKPPFISELVPEDRCHLNGMAMRDGKPRYVTTFNKENRRDSWAEEQQFDDGTLIDVQTSKILVDGMIMPHSPRYHEGKIYVCESGRGLVWRVDPESGAKTQMIQLPGFLRGMTFLDDIMLVGLSRVRDSDSNKDMPLRQEGIETVSGVWLINLNDDSVIAYIKFEDDVDQIYDIGIIPNGSFPELLDVNNPLIRHLYDYAEDLM